MPLFDLALLTVFTVSLYLGASILRRYGNLALTFGVMLLIDSAMAAVSLAARLWSPEGEVSEVGQIVGVIAVGGGICLVAVPPMLRELARRALIRDHLRIARALVDLRELLQPGMGSAQERELIDTIIAVRGGRIDEAVERLREARTELEPRARRRLDERIVMTYLYARQWPEAIEQYERLTHSGAQSASLQLLVEMVRAYCEADNLEAASELVAHLEASEIREDPALSFLLNRSRLVFLAFVGRTGAVERLSGPRGPLGGMPREAGAFWSGVARLHAGDRSGAVASLKDAVKYSSRDKRARQVAESALERAEASSGEPRAVPPAVATLADTLTEVVLAAPLAPTSKNDRRPRLVGVAMRRVPVTSTLLAINLAVAAAIWIAFGATADLGALVRAGANVKPATLGGQYWRLVSHQFVHVGLLHLAINGYGLWVLGKISEQLYGSRRFLFIYLGAGIVGGIASTLANPMTSAGASGAIFGLLGATLVELGLHRKKYPQSWTRSLMGLLLLLTVVNVAIGFAYPIIDQAAHLGGLGAGALFGLLLSTNVRWGKARIVGALSSTLATISVLVMLGAGVLIFVDGYANAAVSEQRVTRQFPGGISAELPESWGEASGATVYDESRLALISLHVEPLVGSVLETLMGELHTEQYDASREAGFSSARRVGPRLSLPPPWRGEELIAVTDDVGGTQSYRILVFARGFGGRVVLGSIYVPENLTDQVAPLIDEIIESIRLAPAPKAPPTP